MSKDEQKSQWGARSSGHSRQASQNDSGRQRDASWNTPKKKGWACPGFENLLDSSSDKDSEYGSEYWTK
eukprot:1999033-Heterocapsa_arctica.AAC.1